MPLLHRRAFTRQRPPGDLRPDEEVFLCKITHEIFRSYDEFFERTILCNSLVWSCALTGRAGLTYLEAMESERRARLSLQSFSPALLVPLLHLAALSRRCRLTELCEDVYNFAKDRFFPGETVDVNAARHVCEILQVHSSHSSANGRPKPADHDTIVISDSDEEGKAFQNPTAQVNGRKKKKPLSPSVFKYTVRAIKAEHTEPFTVKANQISRRKTSVSKERLKLLFKQHCEPQNGTIVLKPSTVVKYRLSEQTLSQFFPDEPPLFPFSLHSKGGGRGSPAQKGVMCSQASSSWMKAAAEEKLKLLQQKEDMAAAVQDRTRLKKKEDVLETKRREREEQRRRFEEEKQRRREEKERSKLEKDREREKLKEEKKKYAERLKLWNKPREDMDCEDLKELPSPVPVRTRLPAHLFGEALMVLEFLRAFGEVFALKDEFPDGVSLEVLEEALVGSDPEGPLCELLFFFLSAIFQALDEEQEDVAKEQAEDLSEALDEDCDATHSALSAVSSLAASWSPLHQGCGLKQLDLDSCTLSEILRLHILASGADCYHGNAKFRYQKQGGFTPMDDPCVELRLAEPALLKRLTSTSVYDLLPGEKLRILQALVGKLLTLASSRDLIEDCVEDQRSAKQELREIRAEQHRRDREEAAHRVRLRKEEKLREQELRLKKEMSLKEQEVKGRLNSDTPGEQLAEEDEEQRSKKMKAQVNQRDHQMTSDLKAPCGPPTLLSAEEQEKVRELQERIQKAAACTCLLPLGRDRLYRRYWLLPSAATLFVEDDCFGLTEDMLRPRPRPAQDATNEMEDEEVVQEEPTERSAGSSPALIHTCGPQVKRLNQWFFYTSEEEVDELIEALNPRGHRESGLKEALLQERDRLTHLNKHSHTDDLESSRSVPQCTSAAETLMEGRLRDLLLDIEDRIHQGTLGTLKGMDRQVWRSALEAGNYELLSSDGRQNGGMNGRVEPMEVDSPVHLRARDRLQELKSDSTAVASSGSGTPQPVSSSVRILAQALAHIEQGIERRFIKAPLGDEDSKKDHKNKKNKKKDDDQASDDGSDSSRVSKTVLERWRESLQICSSLSQVFVHLSSLERSVLWSRSVLNARCRICRRKGDADNMLLCDGCDRGHHTHCLRPRLKSVPEGDWFCPDCRPKPSRLPTRHRSSVESSGEKEEESSGEEEESEESEEEEEEEESEVEEESEEESDKEKEEVVRTKKNQAPPPKGKCQQAPPPKGQQATPKGQQATAKNNMPASTGINTSASKSSGKKATPPTVKANTSAGKAPARSGSRVSARLSLEILAPNRNTKTSLGPTDPRKRPQTDVAPPLKPSRPVLPPSSSSPSSSSSRRSSGRNYGVHELSACEQLTVELVRHEDSWPFKKLVSRTQVPDYYDIVKKPIALSTIREKVNNCEYQTAEEFVSDVDLMFSNCLQYNPRHTTEAKAGHRLQQFFHSELDRLGLSERSAPPAKHSRH
ncbi:bromodomain adjacent to zinc finger domain protein 1A isoform X2 [Cyclopterus lumpus]|uniref:bromodomain adjacent to zinc finger domain protein 1A isoform X2 n=1 Tax=Cyclopterus lumpus TaxID=8103 RepID=UPI001486E436|nr:bromodomain adjacent to zinc finger domain protein 1A isoform X2 [Cyclopterus lumpus]